MDMQQSNPNARKHTKHSSHNGNEPRWCSHTPHKSNDQSQNSAEFQRQPLFEIPFALFFDKQQQQKFDHPTQNKNNRIRQNNTYTVVTVVKMTANNIIRNPYAMSSASAAAAAAAAAEALAAAAANNSNNNTNSENSNSINNTATTMGKQSQFCNGFVSRARARATKIGNTKAKLFARANLVQRCLGGGEGFVSHLHCRQYVAINKVQKCLIASPPHRSHDWRCWIIKSKFAGLSTFSRMVEREATNNIAINNRPLVPLSKRPKWDPVLNPNKVFPLFVSGSTSETTTTTTIDNNIQAAGSNITYTNLVDEKKVIVSVESIKTAIDIRMTTNEKLCKSKVSRQLGAAINYVISSFQEVKKSDTLKPLPVTEAFETAYAKYQQFFPSGTCQFVFPANDAFADASPDYHVVERQPFIFLDWKLMFPRLEVSCPVVCLVQGKKCPLYTQTHKTNLAKDKTFFPIWGHQGLPTWALVTTYKCVSRSGV
jgi:hypothetical protein